MPRPVLSVEALSAHYLTRTGLRIRAVDGVSFSVGEGEILGIAGESGCGKTTLVSACMGLYLPPLVHGGGDVKVDGISILGMAPEQYRSQVLGRLISMIPQGALNSLNPTRRIKDMAADMIASHESGIDRREIHERLRERFERIGLDAKHVLNAYPVELPAGTKQRVVIGISTLLNPKIVIADEPTSALDVSTQKSVVRLLFDLMDASIVASMLFITHELPLLRHVATRIAVMYAGEFIEVGPTEDVIFDPMAPYTQALMGSMLSIDPTGRQNRPVALEGAPPDLKLPIAGCRFSARCREARPDCSVTEQELRTIGIRQVRCRYVG
jgi:peptide/nickel transport system ATP-binding protein